MRHKLSKLDEVRDTFTGEFVRFGQKPGWHGNPETTILLANVRTQSGTMVADHLWFNLTKGFALANLKNPFREGDTIQFVARVTPYTKGYQGRREDVWKPVEADYKLSRPTKIVNLDRQDTSPGGEA